ncbi:MAG: outer membrane lipid asymmetry maintenance protein MlaD [Deltaproteobacteria bacterium]|nr:outer membrane lipid asymmetry maintenance protein MlaD [Candidatus Anaeroferrophillus wilburensis]MBN2888158.1 outer membrane lipid asymmetry maintenance protein MlaD [Deltaproteobacteria bacterium]
MAKKRFTVELVVGFFMLMGFLAVAYLAMSLGGINLLGTKYMRVYAHFNSASGLKAGAQVQIAGVPVGKVDRISLDENEMAKVELLIDPGVELQADVIASIKTQGIIGDKFVKISPGGDDELLKDGDRITETESAIDLEELISKYVFGEV